MQKAPVFGGSLGWVFLFSTWDGGLLVPGGEGEREGRWEPGCESHHLWEEGLSTGTALARGSRLPSGVRRFFETSDPSSLALPPSPTPSQEALTKLPGGLHLLAKEEVLPQVAPRDSCPGSLLPAAVFSISNSTWRVLTVPQGLKEAYSSGLC